MSPVEMREYVPGSGLWSDGGILFSEAARVRPNPGGQWRGQAGERQTVSLFLNPSGHYSCQGEADGS